MTCTSNDGKTRWLHPTNGAEAPYVWLEVSEGEEQADWFKRGRPLLLFLWAHSQSTASRLSLYDRRLLVSRQHIEERGFIAIASATLPPGDKYRHLKHVLPPTQSAGCCFQDFHCICSEEAVHLRVHVPEQILNDRLNWLILVLSYNM